MKFSAFFFFITWKLRSECSKFSSGGGMIIGAFVGGGAISIFGFCSRRRQ